MERPDIHQNERIELRIPAEDKALIARAAALEHMNLTGFILRTVLPRARDLVSQADHVAVSERDTLKILDLLENPPALTDRMIRAKNARQTLT